MKIISINENDTIKYFAVDSNDNEIELKVWFEKSKATELSPNGIPHIILPAGNECNRQYLSLSKFNKDSINGEYELSVKSGEPRSLQATGARIQILSNLNEEDAYEYKCLIDDANERLFAIKTVNKMKVEDMNREQLEQRILLLNSGETTVTPKNFLGVFTPEEHQRYSELLEISSNNKMTKPRAIKVKGKMTDAEKLIVKIKKSESEKLKAEKLLAALMANLENSSVDISDGFTI